MMNSGRPIAPIDTAHEQQLDQGSGTAGKIFNALWQSPAGAFQNSGIAHRIPELV
jgi:hypothetical protein